MNSEIIRKAELIFGSYEKARAWLYKPDSQLQGQTPCPYWIPRRDAAQPRTCCDRLMKAYTASQEDASQIFPTLRHSARLCRSSTSHPRSSRNG